MVLVLEIILRKETVLRVLHGHTSKPGLQRIKSTIRPDLLRLQLYHVLPGYRSDQVLCRV